MSYRFICRRRSQMLDTLGTPHTYICLARNRENTRGHSIAGYRLNSWRNHAVNATTPRYAPVKAHRYRCSTYTGTNAHAEIVTRRSTQARTHTHTYPGRHKINGRNMFHGTSSIYKLRGTARANTACLSCFVLPVHCSVRQTSS